MNESKQRIAEYKKLLPDLKERVVAVALLLVISFTMVITTSFAWVVLSRSPEVTGVTTNIASNGNLEIALATGDGTIAPGESQVGDSSATEGQSITAANITWGNMINLNDSVYGLENLVLRPAQLNTASLLDSPLYGAEYGDDGRITKLNSSFAYTVWNPPTDSKPGHFGVSDQFGVRAISSTKIEAVGAEALYFDMVSKAKETNLAAATMYVALGNNSKYMPSLATMMGLYMTARMNPSNATLSNPDCASEDIQNLRDMYAAFLECFDKEAEAMAALVNLQLFLEKGEGNYDPYTAEKIYASTTAGLKAEGVQISNFDQFIKDRNTIATDLEKLKTIASSGTSLKWKDSKLNEIVNNLVDVGKCTIGADNTPISSIGASNAMGYLSGTQEARITNGILYRFEERTGGYIQVKNLGISATVERSGITIPATVKANIQTTAPRDYNLFTNDLKYAESLNTGDYKGGTEVAQDTFGLAVDFWVRTNAQAHYLVLEGNVLTESHEVRAKGKDINGNEVELYTVTLSDTDEEGKAISYDLTVYKGETEDEEGNEVEVWKKAETHETLTDEDLGGAEPIAKMETITTVIGYEGENRVWDSDSHTGLRINSTTQGAGSCYVYYADTPEDQARSLKLLEAMNVAFVDGQGKLMASAKMDTEHPYAANGKVIVPLVLNTSESIHLGEDVQGEIHYAITALEQNVATRITAIVYLDGTKLNNDDVLAAADIQGQLNIQFGAYSPNLASMENEELMSKELRVSATVKNTSFDYDKATGPMISNVTVNVDGAEPNKVEAFFLRAINSTQGSRETTMMFTNNGNGEWVADYTFKVPGNYVLRSVRLDGIEYDLMEPQTVKITGFAVESLTCSQAGENRHITAMTAANSSSFDMTLNFATDNADKMPKKVQGRFLKDDDGSAVNVDFTYDPTTGKWNGSAEFLSSGDYTMQYLVLDGEHTELPSEQWLTASVTLGMRVAIYTTSPHSFKYVPSEMTDNQKRLGMQVTVMDNAGNEILGLEGVKLTYGMKGSGIKKMDTDLTWNGIYYVGELPMVNEEGSTTPVGGPGIWQFSVVTVGSNTITNATTSPTFTILSPEPPEYYDHSTVAYQYTPGKDATMNVQITNSAAAGVSAYIIKAGAAEGKWVTGTIGGELTTSDGKTANHWNFPIPTDANGYQDGNWQLTKLRLWNVFAADGTAYTEESPLEIDVSDTNNVSKVVNRIFVTFATDKDANGQPTSKSKDFGKDATGKVTGAFMGSYTISGLAVEIKDFENEPIQGISEVQLQYVYGNDSKSYGGYTSTSLNNSVADFTIVLVDDGTHMKFAQSGSQTIQYAGSWATTFSFKVNGQTVTYSGDKLPVNAPVFTVSSVKPSVTITGVTPGTSTSIPTKITWTKNWRGALSYTLTDNKTNALDTVNNTVTVYAKATTGSDGEGVGTGDAGFVRPQLTFAASGIDNSTKVTFTIPKGNATNDISVTLTGTTGGTYTLGNTAEVYSSWSLATYSVRGYFGHETQTIETVTVTKDGIDYTVTLDKPIIINNPSSVNKTS